MGEVPEMGIDKGMVVLRKIYGTGSTDGKVRCNREFLASSKEYMCNF
jgi:hypothetical protein